MIKVMYFHMAKNFLSFCEKFNNSHESQRTVTALIKLIEARMRKLSSIFLPDSQDV